METVRTVTMREKGNKRQKNMQEYIELVKDYQKKRGQTGLELDLNQPAPSHVDTIGFMHKSPGRSDDADSDMESGSDDYDEFNPALGRPGPPRPGQRRGGPSDITDQSYQRPESRITKYTTGQPISRISRHSPPPSRLGRHTPPPSMLGRYSPIPSRLGKHSPPPSRLGKHSPRHSPTRCMDINSSGSNWNSQSLNRRGGGSRLNSFERRVTADVRNLPPLLNREPTLLDGRTTPQQSFMRTSNESSRRGKPVFRPAEREHSVIRERPVSRAGRTFIREEREHTFMERPKSRAGRTFKLP